MANTEEKRNISVPVYKEQAKDYYLQMSGLPANFSMDKLDSILNMIYPALEAVDNISQYIRLLESVGVLSYVDNGSTLIFLRPIESLVRSFIKNRLKESNLAADEAILDEILSVTCSNGTASKHMRQNESNLILLKNK